VDSGASSSKGNYVKFCQRGPKRNNSQDAWCSKWNRMLEGRDRNHCLRAHSGEMAF
jgi:hypothetical protein